MDENPYRRPNALDGNDPTPPKKGWSSTVFKVLAVMGILFVLMAMLLPASRRGVTEAARRNQCSVKMKQIALALQNYVYVHHALPPAHTVDADGKPLHSWRTLILPYLEESVLYRKIDLKKPWDDPANAEARKTRVDAYECPSASDPENYTTYLAIVGPHSCFLPDQPRRLAEITDKWAETLTVIEVDSEHAVPWMSPLDADEELVTDIGPKSKLAHSGGVVHAALVDGSVHTLRCDTPAAQRRAQISIAGNDKVTLDDAN